jgi:hypothetical protein
MMQFCNKSTDLYDIRVSLTVLLIIDVALTFQNHIFFYPTYRKILIPFAYQPIELTQSINRRPYNSQLSI